VSGDAQPRLTADQQGHSQARPQDWFPLRLHDGSDEGADHHAGLARKRRDCPVEQLTPFGAGGPDVSVVYGYQDVAAVLADSERFSLGIVEQRYRAVLGRSLLTAAPAARRALRRVLRERFRPDGPSLADLVENVVTARVEALRAACRPEGSSRGGAEGPVDLVDLLATPVPPRVLVALLGMPEQEWVAVAELSAATAGLLHDPRRALRAARRLRQRFVAELRAREGQPRDDLLAALAATELDGTEVISSLLLLAWAGTETAAPAIANCLYALLTHPQRAEAVRADPELVTAAVDEALRWETPVQVTSRRVEDDVELAGTHLPVGTMLLAHLGAANRDPRHFRDPDSYLPERPDRPPHLAFGHGTHHCLGSQLARLEVASCVRALLQRFPNLRLATGSPAPEGQVVRCPRRLLVRLE
jgi:cytochrome P450